MLAEVVIPPPPLAVQRVIVTKLDALSEQTKKLETIYKQKPADLGC
jgi:restriction endonuclease S subunit